MFEIIENLTKNRLTNVVMYTTKVINFRLHSPCGWIIAINPEMTFMNFQNFSTFYKLFRKKVADLTNLKFKRVPSHRRSIEMDLWYTMNICEHYAAQ